MKKIRLLLVDDHRIFRSGIRALLEEEADIEVLGEAGNWEEAHRVLEKEAIDLVLMDINMKETSGIRITERLVNEFPEVDVLGLTMHEDGESIERMMDAGAKGYVFKNAGEEELQEGIRRVASGELYFSSHASENLIGHLRRQKLAPPTAQGALTEREVHVLRLIAEEHTNGEIAEILEISPKTVDGHRRHLFQKLGVRNSAGLIRVGIEQGWIPSAPSGPGGNSSD